MRPQKKPFRPQLQKRIDSRAVSFPIHHRPERFPGGKCYNCRKGGCGNCNSLNCECPRCHPNLRGRP